MSQDKKNKHRTLMLKAETSSHHQMCHRRSTWEYVGKVLDDMVMTVLFTDVPLLEGIRSDGEPLTITHQLFDPQENRWIVLTNVFGSQ